MELGRALLLILAIVAMASLPALIALVFCADEIIDRVACGYAEWRERRRERRTIVRLDRAVEADALTRDIDLTAFDRPDRRPLEELAADLRRLRSQGWVPTAASPSGTPWSSRRTTTGSGWPAGPSGWPST